MGSWRGTWHHSVKSSAHTLSEQVCTPEYTPKEMLAQVPERVCGGRELEVPRWVS